MGRAPLQGSSFAGSLGLDAASAQYVRAAGSLDEPVAQCIPGGFRTHASGPMPAAACCRAWHLPAALSAGLVPVPREAPEHPLCRVVSRSIAGCVVAVPGVPRVTVHRDAEYAPAGVEAAHDDLDAVRDVELHAIVAPARRPAVPVVADGHPGLQAALESQADFVARHGEHLGLDQRPGRVAPGKSLPGFDCRFQRRPLRVEGCPFFLRSARELLPEILDRPGAPGLRPLARSLRERHEPRPDGARVCHIPAFGPPQFEAAFDTLEHRHRMPAFDPLDSHPDFAGRAEPEFHFPF